MKKESENDRTVLAGKSKGIKRHNRRAKALVGRPGTQKPGVRKRRMPVGSQARSSR